MLTREPSVRPMCHMWVIFVNGNEISCFCFLQVLVVIRVMDIRSLWARQPSRDTVCCCHYIPEKDLFPSTSSLSSCIFSICSTFLIWVTQASIPLPLICVSIQHNSFLRLLFCHCWILWWVSNLLLTLLKIKERILLNFLVSHGPLAVKHTLPLTIIMNNTLLLHACLYVTPEPGTSFSTHSELVLFGHLKFSCHVSKWKYKAFTDQFWLQRLITNLLP